MECAYMSKGNVYMCQIPYMSQQKEKINILVIGRHTQSLDGVVVNALAYEAGRRDIESI